jgi:putative nucleotidyltransferase with HDIG domain
LPEDPNSVNLEKEVPKRPRVLAVDDDGGVLRALTRILSKDDYEVITTQDPIEAISILWEKEVAVVISDQMMPIMTGVELLTFIRQHWPSTVCIMMTACEDIRLAADVVNRKLVHFFITKPWDSTALRKMVQEAFDLYQQKTSQVGGLASLDAPALREIRAQASMAAFSLARAVDARDRYTHRHSENVAALAQIVGKSMGLADDQIEELRIGGLLHDVGKIGVSDGVLLKPGRLTEDEFKIIKTHPTIGVSIIEPIHFPWSISAVVGQHHENHDGSGYPQGIKGDDISLGARIVHVVDAYEAMVSNRVYRSSRDPAWIVSEFQRCNGTQFHPETTNVFLSLLAAGKIEGVLVPEPKK